MSTAISVLQQSVNFIDAASSDGLVTTKSVKVKQISGKVSFPNKQKLHYNILPAPFTSPSAINIYTGTAPHLPSQSSPLNPTTSTSQHLNHKRRSQFSRQSSTSNLCRELLQYHASTHALQGQSQPKGLAKHAAAQCDTLTHHNKETIISTTPQPTFATLSTPIQHALLCSSLRHIFQELGLSPSVHLPEQSLPSSPLPPQLPLSKHAPPTGNLKLHGTEASADEDALVAKTGKVDDDESRLEGSEDREDKYQTYREDTEEDELVEDLLREDHASPPAYRAAAAPVHPKKTPSIFQPSRKRPAPEDASRATKVPRTKTWTNTVRAANPLPRNFIQRWGKQAQQPAGRGSKKMEYRSDRVAKPLQHVPAPSEMPAHRSAADAVVESWVEGLLDFFELDRRIVETPGLPRRRDDVNTLNKAMEIVEHMGRSVRSMRVEVLKRTSLRKTLSHFKVQRVDGRWGEKAVTLMREIGAVANVVEERTKVRSKTRTQDR